MAPSVRASVKSHPKEVGQPRTPAVLIEFVDDGEDLLGHQIGVVRTLQDIETHDPVIHRVEDRHLALPAGRYSVRDIGNEVGLGVNDNDAVSGLHGLDGQIFQQDRLADSWRPSHQDMLKGAGQGQDERS